MREGCRRETNITCEGNATRLPRSGAKGRHRACVSMLLAAGKTVVHGKGGYPHGRLRSASELGSSRLDA